MILCQDLGGAAFCLEEGSSCSVASLYSNCNNLQKRNTKALKTGAKLYSRATSIITSFHYSPSTPRQHMTRFTMT